MTTFGDLFCGGGGFSLGAIAAGLTPAWSIEHDPAIADVYRANVGEHVIVGDVASVNPRTLHPVDVLLASPPCQDASVARSKHLAPRGDRDLGTYVLDYAEVLKPSVVIVENVPPYQHTRAFKAVVNGLFAAGYMVSYSIENAANYGVPQTRRRLILRAVRDRLMPSLPQPQPWRGWYDAISDLVPTLPGSAFAPWQLARLEKMALNDTALLELYNTAREPTQGVASAPAMTIIGGMGRRPSHLPVAYLVGTNTVEGVGVTVPHGDAPSQTVTTNADRARAFLIGGGNTSLTQIDSKPRHSDAPAFTTTGSSDRDRAFVVHPNADNEPFVVRDQDDPMFTVATFQAGQPRAFVVSGQNGNDERALTNRERAEPMYTVNATADRGIGRAWLEQGRVVKLTPRALARFQTFGDEYELPPQNALACKIIGNAVPPLLAQQIVEATV